MASYEGATPAQLRHSLRTPLNHVIGYAEMMLDDLRDSVVEPPAGLITDLEAVVFTARELVRFVQNGLPPETRELSMTAVRDLQSWLRPHALMLIESIGGASTVAGKAHLEDLGRMRTAAERLLAFTEGRLDSFDEGAPGDQVHTAQPVSGAARILIIDDSPANRDIVRRNLERSGYVVTAVADGPAGLDVLSGGDVDLVLLDVIMPEMSGFEVLHKLKSNPRTAETPVIIMSALDEASSVIRCLELGAEDYFMKPFDAILLRSRVRATLERFALKRRCTEISDALAAVKTGLKQISRDSPSPALDSLIDVAERAPHLG